MEYNVDPNGNGLSFHKFVLHFSVADFNDLIHYIVDDQQGANHNSVISDEIEHGFITRILPLYSFLLQLLVERLFTRRLHWHCNTWSVTLAAGNCTDET